jgi:hypothetical protein
MLNLLTVATHHGKPGCWLKASAGETSPPRVSHFIRSTTSLPIFVYLYTFINFMQQHPNRSLHRRHLIRLRYSPAPTHMRRVRPPTPSSALRPRSLASTQQVRLAEGVRAEGRGEAAYLWGLAGQSFQDGSDAGLVVGAVG